MSGVYLGRGSAPMARASARSLQHVGIHLLVQLIAGGKAAVSKKHSQGPAGGTRTVKRFFFPT